jgi:hypothetical protein
VFDPLLPLQYTPTYEDRFLLTGKKLHIPEQPTKCVSFHHASVDSESGADPDKSGRARDCMIGRFPLALMLKIFREENTLDR